MSYPRRDTKSCTCPAGGPRVFHHRERYNALITTVAHDPWQCPLTSLRISAYRLSQQEHQDRIEAAIGSREALRAR